MNTIACIDKTAGTTLYNFVVLPNSQNNHSTAGYFTSRRSRDLTDAIQRNVVFNCISYKQEKLTHALLQPVTISKNELQAFPYSQYTIGYMEGLREKKDTNIFYNEELIKYAKVMKKPKPTIELVYGMRNTVALDAKTLVQVLRVMLSSGRLGINDLLVFNLTSGNLWMLTGI